MSSTELALFCMLDPMPRRVEEDAAPATARQGLSVADAKLAIMTTQYYTPAASTASSQTRTTR